MVNNKETLASILASLAPKPEFPHVQSQVEEEMVAGAKPPAERGGRLPIFYRTEVEAIKRDERPIEEIAHSWGVSYDTIQKVKQRGRFANVPYIPRDEIDRRINYVTGDPVQPAMSTYLAKSTTAGHP
jgi:hypothetical protein